MGRLVSKNLTSIDENVHARLCMNRPLQLHPVNLPALSYPPGSKKEDSKKLKRHVQITCQLWDALVTNVRWHSSNEWSEL